ncbi:MAG TPA: SPFH domain-containing protein [Virgibacillus sp.]|nr:SPFH domain-containing protein [Virgibacillus sp.]
MSEHKAWSMSGFLGFFIVLILVALAVFSIVMDLPIIGGILIAIGVLFFFSLTIVTPNQSKVINFFGKYVGSLRESGWYMTVPLATRSTVSLKVRNFNSETLKVNDVDGNPIEIAAVVVSRVVDSAKAVYDVDNYSHFVKIQSESAIRHIASQYPYNTIDDPTVLTLRANSSEVSEELKVELQERLQVAGVEVIETRLTHLAYSAEIAQAMLQRQQASAVISARRKIVEGAVGMAKDAVDQLEKEATVSLDDERKMHMVNNLMVAIISDQGTQPVVNTGKIK